MLHAEPDGAASDVASGQAWPAARTGWYTTAILAIAYFLSYMDRSIIGLLVEPIKADLRLSDTELGFVTGLSFSIFYALAGIWLGRLADRGNRKWIVVVAVLVWSMMTALCGFSWSFVMLFLARVGVGIGEAGLNPAALSMISDHFPPARRPLAITIFNVGGSLGGGLAFVLGAAILALAERLTVTPLPLLGTLQPWQWTFLIVGAPGLLLALIAGVTLREPPRRGSTATALSVPLGAAIDYYRANSRCFAGLFLAPSLVCIVTLGYLVWAPSLFTRVFGLDLKFVGAVFGGTVLLFAVTGNFLCAALVRRFERKGRTDAPLRAMRLIVAIAVPAAALGPLMPHPALAIATLGPAIGLLVATIVLPNIAIQTIVPNRMRGQTVAILLLGVNIIGGGLGPISFALLTDGVFADERLIHWSGAVLSAVVLPLALLTLHWALPGYRATAARA